ncbi:hypothetical protein [Cytobacillus purgationiresistens]|uniref:Uncharacterized protein n=1 Tax=Cytobacillus purgationiresistens TaxID=863449 RepID=A0ABU0AL92_9BACI|nr:hypothetical protein [Cytobacillus purgationiresistens]MDQ0272041.1 hypothetical protein [Cytobacillus purgationiresistens]
MYRFSINQQEWILRFSINVTMEKLEKQRVFKAIVQMGSELIHFTHGDSFIIIDKEIGMVVFNVETIPSFILIVSNVVSDEDWYMYDGQMVKRYTGK